MTHHTVFTFLSQFPNVCSLFRVLSLKCDQLSTAGEYGKSYQCHLTAIPADGSVLYRNLKGIYAILTPDIITPEQTDCHFIDSGCMFNHTNNIGFIKTCFDWKPHVDAITPKR